MTLGYNFYEPEFRIFADETNLLSDSQNLYEAQKCFSTHSQLEFSNGGKIILAGVLDKRPALFPYLVSIIHSLTGYSPENVFYFNYTIGFLSLFLTYYLIQLFWGKYWGINGLIYLASYPLFIKYTYSGGFEVFNLFCSLILFIIIYEFIKYPESLKAESLLLFIPLISQSRYESIFSLFITLPLVFYLLPIKEYSKLSYKFYMFPLFLIAPAWLRVITNDPVSCQVENLNDRFGFEWFGINLTKAFQFYFSQEENYGINYVISYLAIIGFIIFIWKTFYRKKFKATESFPDNLIVVPNETSSNKLFWIFIILFYLLQALIRFAFCGKDLTNIIINRVGIFFLPFFVIMAIYLLIEICNKYFFSDFYFEPRFYGKNKNLCKSKTELKIAQLILFVFILSIYILASPSWSDLEKRNYLPYVEFNITKNYLEKNYPNKNEYIILHYKANLYSPFGYSSVGYQYYNKPELHEVIRDFYLKNNAKFFLAFQVVDLKTKIPYKNCVIPNDLKSEIIFEDNIQNNYILRVSKCIYK